MSLTKEDALLAITWFEHKLADTPDTVLKRDYQLARNLYKAGGLNAPVLVK